MQAVGFVLLAGITLDGVTENVALGVTLVSGGRAALLVGIFASNLPESLAGSAQMRAEGLSARRCIGIWTGAAVLLGLAVVGGRMLLAGASARMLTVPLAIAAGAVLASIVDTLAPEAFRRDSPTTALAPATGFALGTHLALPAAAG